ncbi:hypothetical protein ACOMHN_039444 [Nucella lapillus]
MPSSACSGKPEMTWNASKRHHHLRWVFPSDKQGMQATLHRDVVKSLQPNVINDPEDYVIAARRILHRQRVASKLLPRFSRAKSANYVTALSHALKEAQPEQIDVEHVNKLLHTSQAYQAPVFPGRRYTSDDVEKITERLSTYDPEKIPESRGYAIKLELPVVYRKQYSDEDVYNIVKSLSSYNPEKCPPESKAPGNAPAIISAPCRQSLGCNVKKCSASQVQDIVNRLSRYDPWKWPPSSRHPRDIASRA